MRLRITLATVPIVLLIWTGIGAYLLQKHQTDLESSEQASRNLTHAFEENIRRTIEAIDTTMRAARAARAHAPSQFDLKAWEHDSGVTRDLTLQLSFSDRNGDVVASNLATSSSKRTNIADREHFRIPREQPGDSLFISRPVIGRVSGRWSVQFVRKLFDESGAFDGVIVASLDPAFLSRFYTSLDVGNGALLLLGQDGIVRSVAPESVTALASDLSTTELMAGVARSSHGTVRMTGDMDKVDRTYSWRRVDPYGLIVVVGLSRDDALTGYQRDLRGCIALGLVLTSMTLLVTAILARNRRDALHLRNMLQAAVENISQGLLVVDLERKMPVLNARAAELLELPPHLARPGTGFDTLLEWQVANGEFDGEDAETVRALVRSGGLVQGESVYHRRRHNGTVLEIHTKVLESGLGVRTYTDITEQKRTAQILAEARDAAEAAARTRTEFLAVMSHEIRTPLNGVIGLAGLLEDMELAPAQREYVRLIRQSGDHLLELVNDILDFARLDADRVQLEDVDFDPGALIRDVAGMLRIQACTKGLSLSSVAAENLPTAVTGDLGRLRQILLNLVGNAVKFTDQGWVKLALAQEPAEDGHVRLLFSVADSGIGIEPEAIERMFQQFIQMDGSISRRFGGSGLGLAICRRLVELMGGSITVDSQPGIGSTFRFAVTLKLAEAHAIAVAETEPEPQTGQVLRVLVAEDNRTNRLVALRMLERLGHRADAVGTGVEAIAALAQDHYDLILMDVMMPEMDGLTATRHIRATESPSDRIAIIGLTAGTGEENLASCLDAGMDAATTKPITLDRLRAAIADGCVSSGKCLTVAKREGMTPQLRELSQMLGDDAVQEILHAFQEDTQSNLIRMRDAVERGDSKAIYALAHSVAGAARNVGADTLAERASALELAIGSSSSVQLASEVRALQTELDAALDGLGLGGSKQPKPGDSSGGGFLAEKHASSIGP
jgi:signal transduction histidine kinase/CheY-like chemotaxis protein/HPt (histidine-containing phosphotransfer) domain-containing protein